MRCPTLAELPSPSAHRRGWPWTEETPQASSRTLDGRGWPRITVVTPSYQHGHFLEETIRSVLLQGYPDLEYIVLDGGSSDDTMAILQRYEQWLAHWSSGPDGGQIRAINAGLSRATGHWRSWLNSDDVYLPGALAAVGSMPRTCSWVVGKTLYIDSASRPIGRFPVSYRAATIVGSAGPEWIDALCARGSATALPQQSTFWTAEAQVEAGTLDETLEYTFDHEFWVRLAYHGFSPTLVGGEFTLYRRHEAQKTRPWTRAASYREEARITASWLARCPAEHRSAVASYRNSCLQLATRAAGRQFAALVARPLLCARRSWTSRTR